MKSPTVAPGQAGLVDRDTEPCEVINSKTEASRHSSDGERLGGTEHPMGFSGDNFEPERYIRYNLKGVYFFDIFGKYNHII